MENRLNKYFAHLAEDYVFLELMPEYMKRMRIDFMRGVPMPVLRRFTENLSGEQGVDFNAFTMGMVNMIGIDPDFKYASRYVKLLTYMNPQVGRVILQVGMQLANAGQLELAAVHFRAALVIDPEDRDALYNYMLSCRDLYLKSDDSEYIAAFKEEVLEALTRLKELDPSIAMVHYYLGFSYINMGRYSLAQQSWSDFMRLAEEGPEKKEIRERLEELTDPVRIERGYLDVIGGRWEQGMAVLEEYIGTEYMDWWPLPYYLGVGYSRLGRYDEALEMLKKAARGNPSSPEIVAELVLVNNALGDELNAEKYRRKLDILNTPAGDES